MKRTKYALYKIISIPTRLSSKMTRTKIIPNKDKPIAVYLSIL